MKQLKDLSLGDVIYLVSPANTFQSERRIPLGPYNVWSVLRRSETSVEIGRPYIINDHPAAGMETMTVSFDTDLVADLLKPGWDTPLAKAS